MFIASGSMHTRRLTVNPAVLADIQERSFQAMTAISYRGLEIGGFLISASAAAGKYDADSLVLVDCSYSFGPSYHLSEAELAEFQTAIDEQRDNGLQVAAYFRSSTRPAIELSPTDKTVLEMLPEVRWALIYRPRVTGGEYSLFQRFEDGTWSGPEDPGYRLATLSAATAAESQNPSPEPPPKPSIQVAQAAPAAVVAATRNPTLLRRAPLFVLAGVGVGLAMYGGFSAWQRSRFEPRQEPSLGLRARLEGETMQITWDRSAPALRAAHSAKLTVQDGAYARVVSLDHAELVGGSLVYRPRSGDVSVKMDLLGDAPETGTAAVRVLVGESAQVPVASTQTPAPVSVPQRRQSFFSPAPDRGSARERGAVPVPEKVVGTDTPQRRTMEMPPVYRAATADRKLTPGDLDLPQFVPAGPSAAAVPDPLHGAEVSMPSSRLSTAPGEAKPLVRPASVPATAAPLSPVRRASVFVPPKPLVRFEPDMREFGWRVDHDTQVSVRVSIDRSGRVTHARPESVPGTPAIAALIVPSVRAASKWKFAPGTQNGDGVPSDYLITFHFRAH